MSDNEILTHELVPEHVILEPEAVDKLLKDMKIDKKQLPKILEIDPVVQAIGAKVGDVLEITRQSPTAGTIKYYRIVIPE